MVMMGEVVIVVVVVVVEVIVVYVKSTAAVLIIIAIHVVTAVGKIIPSDVRAVGARVGELVVRMIVQACVMAIGYAVVVCRYLLAAAIVLEDKAVRVTVGVIVSKLHFQHSRRVLISISS